MSVEQIVKDESLDELMQWARSGDSTGGPRTQATLNRLCDEIEALRRGEFVCRECGLRKDDEHPKGDF